GKYVPLFQQLKANESWHVGATVVMIAFLIVINVIGIQESSALNLVLALVDLVTQFALVILGFYFLLKIDIVLRNIHWGIATTWKADPVAGIVTGFSRVSGTLALWAGIWVGFLAFTILLIATNAGLIGISRLSYSLAGAEMLPRRFATLHPKFKTPYISIIVFGILSAMLVAAGLLIHAKVIDLMSAVYSLAATFAFCSAHLSVMRLR